MKLLATRSFANPKRQLQIENAQHPDHVHKGAIFDIGGDVPIKKMRREDAELIGRLSLAKCVAEPSPENIAKVEAELAVERKRAEREEREQQAALNAPAAFATMLQNLLATSKPATARK
jgi:hypothetical protein